MSLGPEDGMPVACAVSLDNLRTVPQALLTVCRGRAYFLLALGALDVCVVGSLPNKLAAWPFAVFGVAGSGRRKCHAKEGTNDPKHGRGLPRALR